MNKNPDTKTLNKKNRALQLFRQGKLAAAGDLFRQLAKKTPYDPDAWQMLGTISFQTGRIEESVGYFRKAVALNPANHELHYQLGCALLGVRYRDDAIASLRQSLSLKRDFFDAWLTLGNAYAWGGQLQESVDSYHQAMRINHGHPVPYCNLANVLCEQGKVEEAIKNWKLALHIQPDYTAAHSNMLVALNYNDTLTPREIYQQHLEWDRQHVNIQNITTKFSNDTTPDRTLRIGYVSPDIREHSVAYFLEALLEHHDRSQFTIYCYSDVAVPDDNTRYLMPKIDHYKAIANLSGERVKEMVMADGIDILIDLAGHTSGNRAQLFSMKAAPVQVSYLGYANTTGMRAMDYRITDAWADPPGMTDELYTEKLVRLPCGFLCYTPPRGTPDVAAAPVEANGYVTFGSFNHPAKITPSVVSTWCEILKRVDSSRLLLKYRSFTDGPTREHYREMFMQQGIDPDRIELLGVTPSKGEHLACYHRVDIGLDTFPYNGTTTTCDTLWMGVPVIVQAGRLHAGRVGVSLLSQLSLDSLIADSTENYITIAYELAQDTDRISALRNELRSRMSTSTLCNGELHTRELETAFRDMWNKWCTGRTRSG